MAHTQDEINIAAQVIAGEYTFLLEEYWEEDDSGYCCVDYVLAKHTRVTVSKTRGGDLVKTYDLDGLEYEKSMKMAGPYLEVIYRPEFGRVCTCRIDPQDLSIISQTNEVEL